MFARGLRISRASSNSRLMILPSAKAAAGSCVATAATAAPAWRGGCTAVARGSAADVCRSGSLAGGPGKAGGPGLSFGGVGGGGSRSSEGTATAAASAATAAVELLSLLLLLLPLLSPLLSLLLLLLSPLLLLLSPLLSLLSPLLSSAASASAPAGGFQSEG